ncbi:ATP-dependent helicase/nuclease subunit A [compost metagenome]
MSDELQTETPGDNKDALKTVSADFLKTLYELDKKITEVKLDDVSLGPWSHSKLKTLEKCPLQFYLKYVMKAKLPPELAAEQDTSAADVGSAAHKILEHIFAGHEVPAAYALAKAEFVPEKLNEEQWQEKLVGVEMNIISFKDRIDSFRRRHKVKKIYQEVRIGVTKDWKRTTFFGKDVWMRGVIDFIVLLENGDILLIDWKYGPPAASGIRFYKQQLHSYAPLFHFGVTPIKGMTSGIGFIKDGEIILDEYKDEDDVSRKLKNEVEWNVDGAIERVKTDGKFSKTVGSQCTYCEFSPFCKSRTKGTNLKELEEGTKRFIPINPA